MPPQVWNVSRSKPGCYIFLLDESLSMEDTFGGSAMKKSDALADAINLFLAELIAQCEKGGKQPKHYFDVALVGYTTDEKGQPIVGSAFQGPLASNDLIQIDLVSILDLLDKPLRVKEEGGVKIPIWYDPVVGYGTPMSGGLEYCRGLAEMWVGNHPDSVPPIVIHVTDGEPSDGDPEPAARALQSVATAKGNTLLFNVHLSDKVATPTIFPSTDADLPDDFARMLFRMSSLLPDFCVAMAHEMGWDLEPGARGMAFNADSRAMSGLLNVGTLPSGALR